MTSNIWTKTCSCISLLFSENFYNTQVHTIGHTVVLSWWQPKIWITKFSIHFHTKIVHQLCRLSTSMVQFGPSMTFWVDPYAFLKRVWISATGDPRISWFQNSWSPLFRDCFKPQIREFPRHFGILTKKSKKKKIQKIQKIFGNFLEFFLDEFLILFKIKVNSYLEHCQKIKFGGK